MTWNSSTHFGFRFSVVPELKDKKILLVLILCNWSKSKFGVA